MNQLLLFLGFMASSFLSLAQLPQKARLDSLLDYLNHENKLMASLAIHKSGQPIYQHSTGIAGYLHNENVQSDPSTEYRVGSVSKMFTAVIIFQLIEEKLLSPDDKLSSFFPSVPNADKITISQMLNHHSGIHNITDDSVYLTYYTHPKSKAELLQLISNSTPEFDPGTSAAYSNSNYILLTFIAEKLTKKSFAQLVTSRIVNKLHLQHTYVGSSIHRKSNEAGSFRFEKDRWVAEPETDMSVPVGAGAIVSTASDVNVFISSIFEGKLISAAHLKMMKTISDGYGMAMFEIPFYDMKGYGHTGGIDGFQSMTIYFPKDSTAFTILSNGSAYPLNNAVIGLLSIYYNRQYEFPVFKKFQGETADLAIYEGVYSSDLAPIKITIFVEGGKLKAQGTGQRSFELVQSDKDEFVYDPAGIKIKFDPAKHTMVLNQAGMQTVFSRE
jgi:CubicO group peptidase (beta-lactamase class C family)